MKALLLFTAACSALAIAAPASAAPASAGMAGQDMPAGMVMPTPAMPAAPATPECPPEHAAMGHCTPAPQQTAPAPAAAAPADPDCPAEHAAMGHCTPRATPPAPPAAPAADPDCPPEHAAMGHCTPKAAPMAAAGGATPQMGAGGTALPAGNAPPPPAVPADQADAIWGRDVMLPVRTAVMNEHGGGTFSQVMIDLAEVQIRDGKDSYVWAGESWFGGDLNRLTVKYEGEGVFRERVEAAEFQALYSRAIGPYFNLQAGVRHDIRPTPQRTYAVLGFEGLAPYWFEVEGAVYVSDKGDVLAGLEGYYDQRITQRLILQPRAEFNLSAQSVPEQRTGSGLTDAGLGLRLRYEIAREFAPYVGVSWERKFGRTADFARAAGEGTGGWGFVMGVRAWF